ncbi:MarR family winged helix-turn-helix transcriptional regulator [Streptomyces cucumeris]|uniref:MarR family winged helix-turn-helix transcriptional regulator n=1 Tax=Streptomyces cucumeris TaxID=2962890 RepID=UPI003EB97D4D
MQDTTSSRSPEAVIAAHRVPDSMRQSPLHLLRRALQRYTAQWQATVGDVTPPQFAVLTSVGEYPGISQIDLGEVTGIDVATLAPLVLRLEQRGLLNRDVDPANRRRRQLHLTPAGVAETERILPLAEQVDGVMLDGLSTPQRAALLAALRSLSGMGGPAH